MKRLTLKTKWFFVLGLILLNACKTPVVLLESRGDATPLKAEEWESLSQLWQDESSTFRTLQAKGKGVLSWQGKSYDVQWQMRMQRDSAIWISLQAPLLGEVGRILLTTDSVQFIHRLEKQYLIRSLLEMTWVGPSLRSFASVQALLTGQFAKTWLQNDSIQAFVQDPNLWLEWEQSSAWHKVQVNRKGYMQFFQYGSSDDHQQLIGRYGYAHRASKAHAGLPSKWQWQGQWPDGQFHIQWELQSFSVNQHLEMPFSIPKNYKLMQ